MRWRDGVIGVMGEVKWVMDKSKKTRDMEKIERIRVMELRLERVESTVKELVSALERYDEIQDDVKELKEYYDSVEWREDFADDEAGLLPKDLKRGVLSEDGIWNVLSDIREMNENMMRVAMKSAKNLSVGAK